MMYKSLVLRRLSLLTAYVLTTLTFHLGVAEIGSAQEPPKRVSPVTLEAASASVESFARSLALDRVPALFVITQEDAKHPQADVVGKRAGASLSKEPALQEAIATFVATHSTYGATIKDGVLIAQPRDARACAIGLERKLPQASFNGTTLEVLWQLAKVIDPTTPSGPPSVVCAGQCASDDERVYAAQVQLVLDGTTTVADALAEISRQVPGLVWVLRERERLDGREASCRVGYYGMQYRYDTSYGVK